MIDTILFDLDGTLLPFAQEDFIKLYIGLISERAAKFGYQREAFTKALWAGTASMAKNDGSHSNRDAFWETFSGILGKEVLELEAEFEDFYATDFGKTCACLQYKPDHSAFLAALRARGFKMVLATNPLFPPVAVHTRLGWVGLGREDFDYITDYKNSSFCKPNSNYYRAILGAIGKTPEDCLMVGNNTNEDMCAGALGMDVYLLTENIENSGDISPESFKNGSFSDFIAYAAALPDPQ